MKKLLLTTALIACCLTSLIAQPCLPEGIRFYKQDQLDAFQQNHPGCSEIEGDVQIGSPGQPFAITKLDSLNVITSIGGDLTIGFNNQYK